eukprot:16428944-Heterocapsa_arctica.AAC.1
MEVAEVMPFLDKVGAALAHHHLVLERSKCSVHVAVWATDEQAGGPEREALSAVLDVRMANIQLLGT